MENISTADLQYLANLLPEEGNFSLRQKLQAWIEAKSMNADHADISTLAGFATHSTIKEKILGWIAHVNLPRPSFIPDMPSQMEILPKQEIKEPDINDEDILIFGVRETLPEETVFVTPIEVTVDYPEATSLTTTSEVPKELKKRIRKMK